jgi:hypothetical protein
VSNALNFGGFPEIPGFSQARSFGRNKLRIMDTLPHDSLDLALNERTDIGLVGFADGQQCFMDVGVDLGSNVFAFQAQLGQLPVSVRVDWIRSSGRRSFVARVQIGSQVVARDAGDALNLEDALRGDFALRPLVDGLLADAEFFSEAVHAARLFDRRLESRHGA